MRDTKQNDFDRFCRSSKEQIIAGLVELVNQRRDKLRSKTSEPASRDKPKRRNRGTCNACRAQNFEYCMHCVLIDTEGRCTQPLRTANKADGKCLPVTATNHSSISP